MYKDSDWTVYHILTKGASEYYGRGTKWCISGIDSDRWWNSDRVRKFDWDEEQPVTWGGSEFYFYINKHTGKKWAMCAEIQTDDNSNNGYVLYDEVDNLYSMSDIKDFMQNGTLPNFLPERPVPSDYPDDYE